MSSGKYSELMILNVFRFIVEIKNFSKYIVPLATLRTITSMKNLMIAEIKLMFIRIMMLRPLFEQEIDLCIVRCPIIILTKRK